MVKPFDNDKGNGVLLAVVDGLGQDQQAATATQTAMSVLTKYAADSVVSLIKRCHRSLMMTRGAVMTLASVDSHSVLTWLGIGNVEGVLLRADAATIPAVERLPLHGGLVGYQLPILEARRTTLREGDLLMFATDGIDPEAARGARWEDPPQRIAERALEEHFKGNDDGLVLVARYLGTRHE